MSEQTPLAQTPAQLDSLAARLVRIERAVSRIEAVLDHIPALVAAATDTADETAHNAAAAGVDIDARIRAAMPVLERLTAPETLRSMERLLGHLPTLESTVEQLSTTPDMLAAAIDTLDEAAAALAASGIDIPALTNAASDLVTHGARLMQSPEFARLIECGLFTPERLDTLADLGQALADTRDEPAGKAGLIALWRASRDPDIQRALDFGIRFLRRCGLIISAQPDTPDNQSSN